MLRDFKKCQVYQNKFEFLLLFYSLWDVMSNYVSNKHLNILRWTSKLFGLRTTFKVIQKYKFVFIFGTGYFCPYGPKFIPSKLLSVA